MDVKQTSLVALLVMGSLLIPGPGVSWAAKEQSRPLLDNPRDYSVPFREGESLRYQINWKPIFVMPAFKAGELALSIKESHYNKRPVYTISGTASSEGLLSSVTGLKVRDRFESNIDHETFRSYRILRQTRRNERKRDLEVLFEYEQDSTWVREWNTEVQPPLEIKNERLTGIPGPVADILSVFYLARLRTLHPGDSYLIHLNDRGKIKPITIRVQEQEVVPTDIGAFETVRISTMGGLFNNGGDLRIWYSTDRLRIPVKFEADVKLGKVYGKIIGVDTPKMTKSVIQID
ncbi:MAG: DUF3108 domain-containing protein [Acidobacteriota bacterium]